MKVQQISVFIENKTGRLAEVTRVLGGADISIRALSLADTSDFGILRLIVDQTDKAQAILRQDGFTVSKTEVVAIEVPDRPKGLNEILEILEQAGINVEYMYAFVDRRGGRAIIIFRFEDIEKALATLPKSGVQLIKSEIFQTP
ncbi:ACT domain-containing protein [Geothermobacter hydrogeniphilus]|uniref:Amino acid-binding protein n=1 Tax=Geothermobacter hydrogeniphilus TaxID=1969733 RepID=A0A1X0XLC2_9BACT|nr:ACT domain-containing protein [Geothermobacter hydrogeniphilus]ORJ53695.1 amino acid-binding protein [Geothermobacter hydrogeniphilus]